MKMKIEKKVDSFDFRKTKKNVSNYFTDLENLQWEQARLSLQKGLIANYDEAEQKKQSYITIGKDEFNILAKAEIDEEIKKHLSGYYWAKSILSEQEQLYITEYFVNGRYEDEVIDLLGFSHCGSTAFRNLKRRAIYKFAYVLNLVV